MKKLVSIFIATGMVILVQSCTKEQEKVDLETPTEKISYALGLDIGSSLKELDVDLDLPSLIQGMKDTLADKKTLLTQQQVAEVMQDFSKQMKEKQTQKIQATSDNNKKEGESFLAENKEKEGVTTTASGLQYKVIEEGDGPKPSSTDKVTVHYRGTLIDGTEFDSSYKRGQPATFPLNGVIPGWTEGLQMMAVGSKYEFYIPPALAYGERGAGGKIGPNATLIFEVELLSIDN